MGYAYNRARASLVSCACLHILLLSLSLALRYMYMYLIEVLRARMAVTSYVLSWTVQCCNRNAVYFLFVWPAAHKSHRGRRGAGGDTHTIARAGTCVNVQHFVFISCVAHGSFSCRCCSNHLGLLLSQRRADGSQTRFSHLKRALGI